MDSVDIPISKTNQANPRLSGSDDWISFLLVPALALCALPLVGSFDIWFMLTFSGLAMGMIIFMVASGLTLIFGLMDVFNFCHGLFVSLGAYVTLTVLRYFPAWVMADNVMLNLCVIFAAIISAVVVAGVAGWIFERLLVKKVYGQPHTQILITMGGMVVGEELIKVIWGAELQGLLMPTTFQGSFELAGAALERYRVFAVIVGLVVFSSIMVALNRTKVGLLIRAGVQNREMVENFGYRIKTLFIAVFVAGSALAGLGGVMWSLYQQVLYPQVGTSLSTLTFIVVIIGGLGSVCGSFLGALLVGLLANYAGYLSSKIALVSNILLMALILIWRPNGLFSKDSS